MFGVKSINPVPIFFILQVLAIVSCDGNRIDNGYDDDPALDIHFVGVFCMSLSIQSSKII